MPSPTNQCAPGASNCGLVAVAVERTVELARQFADDLEERRIRLERNRRDIVAALGDGILLHGESLPIFTS
ncbi:hypothetical protein ACVWYH_007465 [Bradyrhizobium sp. GM24.11]